MPEGSVRRMTRPVVAYAALLLASIGCLALYDALSGVFEVRYVATGSMEPDFPQGSVVLILKDPTVASIGDVVAYRYQQSPRVVIFHRIVRINGSHIYVKGDAVSSVEMIAPDSVVGVYVAGAPLVMRLVTTLLSDPLLLYVVLAGATAILLLPPRDKGRHEVDADDDG